MRQTNRCADFGTGRVAVSFSTSTLEFKRLIDVAGALLLGTALLPVLLIAAILIRIDSRGPVVFRQKRLGLAGQPFEMLKFRSMVPDAAKMGDGLACYGKDPRVTRVGRILRAAGLDELPQIWNVLRGDMSFVGPRPPVDNELGELSALPKEALYRFCVHPGITGLAQVSGRNELSWPEKIPLDAQYVRDLAQTGIRIDFRIAVWTAITILGRRGIYDDRNKSQKLS